MIRLLTSLIVFGMLYTACEVETTGPDPQTSWQFVNATGADVLLQVTELGNSLPPSKDTIKAFSTLSYKYGDSFPYNGPHVSATFQFFGSSKSCLTFSGAVVDSVDDIRLAKNFIGSSGYVYTIDSALLAKVVPCN